MKDFYCHPLGMRICQNVGIPNCQNLGILNYRLQCIAVMISFLNLSNSRGLNSGLYNVPHADDRLFTLLTSLEKSYFDDVVLR